MPADKVLNSSPVPQRVKYRDKHPFTLTFTPKVVP